MKSLLTRVLSAVIALAIVVALIWWFGANGLKALCLLVPLLGVRELTRILFKPEDETPIKGLFIGLTLTTFILTISPRTEAMLGFTCISIVFCCVSILFEKKFKDLNELSLFQAKSILGFFYVGLLPAMAYRILDLPHGIVWFLLMLAVVFAGDTFAYLTGIWIGKHKLLPNISPKKTIEGSLGGLIGSVVIGTTIARFYLPHVSSAQIIGLCLLTGLVAQLGDLFESMLKRVANRKDSGTLMPGHGGILDRLDGVLFGAPIMLAGALMLENLL